MTGFLRIPAKILSCRQLARADARLCHALGLPAAAGNCSLALMTCDQDDPLYAALDHATKMARVKVVYAKSFYAGSAHASGPLSGEILGVLAADNPGILDQGVNAVRVALDELFAFYATHEGGSMFFPAVIGSVGEYLAEQAGIKPGVPLGYFVAPPIEAMIALDVALKTSEVELVRFFGPPTETNFAGAYVTGSLGAVEAAARAFSSAVAEVAIAPLTWGT